MPITMLDTVDFVKIPSLNLVLPVVSADPTGYEAGFIYNSTSKEVKYHNGTTWVALGPAGAGGPPTGGASGDLTGSYPAPTIVADAVTNAKLANMAANSIKGNNTGSAADPVDLTAAQTKTLLSLDQVDNTSDANKPVSSATNTALGGKAATTTDMIAGNGLTGGGTLAANRTFDVVGGTGITANANDVAINRTTVDTWYLGFGGGTLTGFLSLHADPDSDMKAATKRYVDLTSQGFSFKNAVRAVATSNVAQTGTQTIDGVALIANQRVLCAGQTTPSQNGIWVVAAGAWARAADMDATGELVDGALVPVAEGTTHADTQFICTAIGATPWVPNSSTSTWTRYSGVADVTAGQGLVRTGQALDVGAGSGITVAADTVAVDSTVERNTNKGAVNGYAPLDAAQDVPIANLPTGTTASTVSLGNHTHDSSYVQLATINAKGDLYAGTADNTVSALTAGANGTVLIADSSQATGMRWGTVTGVNRYSADLGAITGGTGLVVTHSLNTRDLTVSVYRTTTPWDVVQCGVEMTSTTTVTLRFAANAAAAAYRVVIVG